MSENSVKVIPCFLCGNPCEIRQSKKQKPYFVCEPCGVQVFVRGETGIALLNSFLESGTVKTRGGTGRVLDVIATVNRLSQLKAKLEEIQDNQGFVESLTGEGSLALAEKALKKEIAEIEVQLGNFTE
jgi:DNA-directed RNA polymerase subunit RPC12/RpoP